MNLAAWRFPVSIRHDVLIPMAVVLGLWATAAWYYSANTYAGGVIATPDQAIAAMKQQCGKGDPSNLMAYPFKARLKGDVWVVDADLRGHFWEPRDAYFGGVVEVKTGKAQSCHFIVS